MAQVGIAAARRLDEAAVRVSTHHAALAQHIYAPPMQSHVNMYVNLEVSVHTACALPQPLALVMTIGWRAVVDSEIAFRHILHSTSSVNPNQEPTRG